MEKNPTVKSVEQKATQAANTANDATVKAEGAQQTANAAAATANTATAEVVNTKQEVKEVKEEVAELKSGQTTAEMEAAGRAYLALAKEQLARNEVEAAETSIRLAKAQLAALEKKLAELPPQKAEEAKKAVESLSTDTKAADGKVEAKKSNAGCNGSRWCFLGGAFVASYSFVFTSTTREGAPSYQVISVVLPAVGARWPLHENVSVDLLAYSSVINTSLAPTNVDLDGCRSSDGGFEDRLPCEGNAVIRPYAAALLGFTVGAGELGLITPAVSAGLGRTAQDPNPRPYFGLMVATGGVFKTFGMGSSDSTTTTGAKP